MKKSDAITYNNLTRFAAGMPAGKNRTLAAYLLTNIRAMIVGEYSKIGFENARNAGKVNWEYFHCIREAWSEIKHAKNPRSKLVARATKGRVADFH